jgi:all-trans-8'-apo-beta-carotenal 15,15'-oxygenase
MTPGVPHPASMPSVASFPAPAMPPAGATHAAAVDWRASLRDLPREHGFEPLRVEGTIPAGLSGTLYRTGPALFSTFGNPYGHWFDGDGAVSAVRFANGGALGAVKLVQSVGLVEERRAGRRLYAGYGTHAPGLRRFLPASKRKNPANTSILPWDGRVFALFENGRPTEIAPGDLSTVGEDDLAGAVVGTFSAHPHAVPSRRAIYNFGIRYGVHMVIDLYELSDAGRARKLGEVPLARPTMIHDFIATEKHLVFFAPPLKVSPLRLLFGLDTLSDQMRFQASLGTDVIVVPIDDPKRWTHFTVEPFYQWHFVNAYERGAEIVVDVVRYADFDSNRWFGDLVRPRGSAYFAGELWRVTLDPVARRATSEPRWAHPCEFPRVAPAVEATRHTIAWVAANAAPAGHPVARLHDAIARVEVDTGRASVWPSGGVASEPVFVPRPDAGPGCAEDDGWLLVLVYDPALDASNITVLDARDPSAGPLARAWFDHHVPPTTHGAFAPGQIAAA